MGSLNALAQTLRTERGMFTGRSNHLELCMHFKLSSAGNNNASSHNRKIKQSANQPRLSCWQLKTLQEHSSHDDGTSYNYENHAKRLMLGIRQRAPRWASMFTWERLPQALH